MTPRTGVTAITSPKAAFAFKYDCLLFWSMIMVSECANPGCGAQFLFFGQGKLVALRRPVQSSYGSNVEFFWLCGDCARHMDMEVTVDGEMNLVSLEKPALQAA
jgi:hypothetical protein